MAAKKTGGKMAAAPVEAAADAEGSDAPEPFTYQPKNGGTPIVLPSAAEAIPKGKALRFFYQMNKRKGDFIGQAMFALDSAGVSEAVQDRIFDLDDDEALELMNEWAGAITGGSVGES